MSSYKLVGSLLASVLLALSSLSFVFGPAVAARRTQPGVLAAPIQAPLPQSFATVLERRVLTLDYPPYIRSGDIDTVRLTFVVDDGGGASTLQPSYGAAGNVFDTYHVLAEARLDLGGAEINPPNTVSQPLLPGKSATFFWSVFPRDVGQYHGTVWFYLRFIPKNGGPETRRAISAQSIEIDSSTLLGIQAGPARWLGVLGVFFGSLLGFPFVEQVLRWLSKKRGS